MRIFETEDPNHFWVECDGRGKALVPGYPQGYCENHYIHSFELENGRIKRNREFMNPMQKLRALGIAVPQIKRDGTNPIGFTDANELREKNRATVEKYMNTKGQDRLRRHELFVEDGCGGLWTTDTGSPIVIRGKDKLAEHAVWSLKCFPDWEWYNINIFGTDDPNHFWVECDGHGKILFPGYPEGYYENHFLHSFELEDGKIKRNREFMNVFQQLRALSIPVPEIKREGIPT